MNYAKQKQALITAIDNELRPAIAEIASTTDAQNKKAKAVNYLVNQKYAQLHGDISSEPKEKRQNSQILLNYCYAVKALDYRNKVWTYEYMALSRRVGELWERFCKAAWDYPTISGVKRMSAPSFESVMKTIEQRFMGLVAADKTAEAKATMQSINDLIGSINMSEDEMFTLDGTPHIIDFKSGFGSNEKGNMLRLRAVGKAYRLWNPDTKLLFLVRQKENNNYLNVIKKEGLWDVSCGSDAYDVIDELTGSDFSDIRSSCIDFENDFSDDFLEVLDTGQGNLRSYFVW